MTCAKCKGDGTIFAAIKIITKLKDGSDGPPDWIYKDISCPQCCGKGYLTPEEQGLGKF